MNKISDAEILEAFDPRGIIQESYLIDGISMPECRSIFFEWAMSSGADLDSKAAITYFLEKYRGEQPDHPMTRVLIEGLQTSGVAKRRGGARARAR